MRKADITADLVEALIAAQFPEWSDLPVRPVEIDGWDNTTFRLGSSMSVRLPSGDAYAAQVDKEQHWLPVLAPQLPYPIPLPLTRGEPSEAFPRPWSIYRWIEGEVLTIDRVADTSALAIELAGFLADLYTCTPAGPAPGAHSFGRGGPVSVWVDAMREHFDSLGHVIDASAAGEVWHAALTADHAAAPVWVHGDVTGTNLLVRNGRLAGVLDFGCSAFGDPACDLTIAWTFFADDDRARFKESVPVEPSAWTRARGWALWKALNHLAQDQAEPGRGQRSDRRMGWRFAARDVITALIADHRRE